MIFKFFLKNICLTILLIVHPQAWWCGFKCAKLKILNQIVKMDDFHLGRKGNHSWKNGCLPTRNTIVSFSTTILQRMSVLPSHMKAMLKMKFFNGENKENTQMLVFLKEHTNHFPRMVVLFLGWKPLGQRSSRFELKVSLFVKAINHCVTPLSFYKYNILTIGNIVIITEGQGKKKLIN